MVFCYREMYDFLFILKISPVTFAARIFPRGHCMYCILKNAFKDAGDNDIQKRAWILCKNNLHAQKCSTDGEDFVELFPKHLHSGEITNTYFRNFKNKYFFWNIVSIQMKTLQIFVYFPPSTHLRVLGGAVARMRSKCRGFRSRLRFFWCNICSRRWFSPRTYVPCVCVCLKRFEPSFNDRKTDYTNK